jgi:hypothetical protein
LAQTNAQTSLLSYDLTAVKPVEVANLNKQGTLLDSQKLRQDKQNDTILLAYNLTVYYCLKTSWILVEQIASRCSKDTDTKTYNLTDIMPVQKLSLQEQAEAQRGQTMNTRSDGTTPIAGSIGKQNAVIRSTGC